MKRFLSMLLVLAIMVGTVPTALAATPEAQKGYYGNRLTDQEGKVDRAAAIAFYEALGTMNFASGENVPVTDPTVVKLAESYAGGSDTLLRSFGAAVDSFRYDHTEYFYVDWDMLSVNVGRKDDKYVVNIGTGRTDSYLRDKTADISSQITAYNTALDTMVNAVKAELPENATIKAKAKAANEAVCGAVKYSFCDNPDGTASTESKYIRTAYGALVNGKAVCEGYARLYKAVLNELGVNCELVSGYFIDGEAFEPHMWNYVQDEEGNWYAVDVTMNDGHRLQMGGIETTYDKYFWQTDEVFSVDHFEDGVVSSVQYKMPYPELHKFWVTPTSSGLFDSDYGAYGDQSGFWFSYGGKSAEDLEKEGLYMAFRTATTNLGTVAWSPWQSANAMDIYHKDGVVSDNGKTYFLMPNKAMFALEAGIFDTAEDVENKVGDTVVSVQYSEEAVTSHLIEKLTVENPTHDPDYIAPTRVRTTEPYNLLQAWVDVTGGTQHVSLTYGDPLRVVEGQEFELTWDVSSYNRRDLSLEAVQKYAKVENVQFDGDRTISFDFTPSRAYNHNMIFYDFTINNMVNVIDDGKDGVAVPGFSIGARYEDDIACCKIFNDGRLYINSYAQPSIAMNGDLSTTGWTYTDVDEDGNETKRNVSESQRSQMALVVTRPNDSEELAEAATKEAGSEAAVRATTYEIDLNICGKVVQIPNGSYMKLNLGIPDEFADLVGKEDIKFKLYHFKRNEDGTLNYDNPEEIECVLTPYGIIAEVHSFSPYALVAVDNSKLPEEQKDTSKSIALVCNGHGGKVEGPAGADDKKEGSAVITLNEGESATCTLTPDQGYEVEFVRLNGKSVTVTDNRLTLNYDDIQSSNTLEVGFVATDVKNAEANEGITNVPHITSCTITFQSNGGSAVEPAYAAVGATITAPATPTKSGYHFDGWYTDHEFQHAYDFSTPVNASITLYAKWTEVSSGGSGSGSSSGSGGSTTPTPPVEPVDPPAWENPFTDVAEKDWYYSAVQFAVDNHLFYGVSDTDFSPNSNMTRGMLATVLYRLAKEPETNAGDLFNDVADGQYYTEAVAWAAGKGIVNGYGDGTFGPGNSITREQLAVMLWRYAGSPASAGTLDGFNDRDKIHAWAADALAWAVEQKIVSGRGGGILDPIGQATRAEVAAMLMRYCEAVK